MRYVEELVIAAADIAVRCQENEDHGDSSHVSGNGSRTGEKVRVFRGEKAGSI